MIFFIFISIEKKQYFISKKLFFVFFSIIFKMIFLFQKHDLMSWNKMTNLLVFPQKILKNTNVNSMKF